jgi:tetratricopeptide (TPR) repeat protein
MNPTSTPRPLRFHRFLGVPSPELRRRAPRLSPLPTGGRLRPAALAALALAALLAALLAAAGPALAIGQGRLLGQVNDDSGAPVGGVKVILTTPEIKTYRQEKTTDARGQFSIIILDATRQYQIRFEKEGFAPLEQPEKAKIDETTKETYVLHKGTAAGAAGAPAAAGAAAAAPAPAATGGEKPPDAAALQALKGKNEAVLAYNAGVKAIQDKDLAAAAAGFEKAATLDPMLAPAQAALAEIYLEQHKNAEALAAADRYLALEPGKPRGLQARYDALKGMGDRQRASQALEALIAADPGHNTALRVYNEGADALRAGNLEGAVRDLQRAIDLDPKLDAAYAGLTNIYLSHKQNKEALALADRWLAVRPEAGEALTVRYQALSALKDPRAKEAKVALDAAKSTQTPEAAFNQGVTLFNTGNIAEATSIFESVVARKPELARGHYMLGLCYANAQNAAKAKEQLQEFVRLAPNDPDAAAAKQMLEYLN